MDTRLSHRMFEVLSHKVARPLTRFFPLAGLGLALAICGCGGSLESQNPKKAAQPVSQADTPSNVSLVAGIDLDKLEENSANAGLSGPTSSPLFTDIAHAAGAVFRYDNGHSPQRFMTQSTGGGVGWTDYDRDGFLDLFLVQGGRPTKADRATNPLDQLYKNLDGRQFVNVTEPASLVERGFGQGVAVGDFDNDGFDDVYITNVGPDTFFRNLGDGTFEEETLKAKLNNSLWASSAAWGDVDNDGDLDLYVCNYVNYDPENPIKCFGNKGKPGICHPDEIDPVPNVLFVNQGEGTFKGILDEAGLDAPGSKSLGVVIADFNEDRLADIFVANDICANHLFLNEGQLKFRETGLQAGCATNANGQFQASMGVGYGDYNRDGHLDLYLTHFTSDSNTMYKGLGGGMFADATLELGLHLPTLRYLAFGTVMADFDCNGYEDLFVANGHVDDAFQSQGDAYKMPAQLFTFTSSQFRECTSEGGPYFERKLLGRGVATGDFDNDGDVDLAVSHQNDDAAILRNDRQSGHWLKLSFLGTASNRRGVGVDVRVTQEGRTLRAQLAGGTSYCAAHEPAIFMGLGESDADVSIEVTWPSGLTNAIESAAIDRHHLIHEPRQDR